MAFNAADFLRNDPSYQNGMTGTWEENIRAKNALLPYWQQSTFNPDGSVSGPKMFDNGVAAYNPNFAYTPPAVNGVAQPSPYTYQGWQALSGNTGRPPIMDGSGGEAAVNRPTWMASGAGNSQANDVSLHQLPPNYVPPVANYGGSVPAMASGITPSGLTSNIDYAALANALMNQSRPNQPDLASGLVNTAQSSRDRYAKLLQSYAARGLRNPFRMA